MSHNNVLEADNRCVHRDGPFAHDSRNVLRTEKTTTLSLICMNTSDSGFMDKVAIISNKRVYVINVTNKAFIFIPKDLLIQTEKNILVMSGIVRI